MEEKREANIRKYLNYLQSLTQDGPHLGNQFHEDTALKSYLPLFIPKEMIELVTPSLSQFGAKMASSSFLEFGNNAEMFTPTLQQFDAVGNRIDRIHVTEGWKSLGREASLDGIVQYAYEADSKDLPLGPYRRMVQLVRLYLYQPSSGLFGCPLAMTDGSASVLRDLIARNEIKDPKTLLVVKRAYEHLTSRDPAKSWTSGQWMTEKRGGSDVSGATETIAMQYKGNKYKLYGYKWFSSAAEGNMSLALARIIDDKDGALNPEQIRKIPVSLFLLKTRKKTGALNGIQIIKMKDKLGTRQLPTAELLLNGCKAYLISSPGKGIKGISTMLNITRIYNASSAVSSMRRLIALLRDFSNRREVFGKLMNQQTLHLRVLSEMEVTFRGNLIFYLKISELLSKKEARVATETENNLARIMTPVLKLFTAKEVMKIATEGVESFGALGYIESSHIPVILRDAQVLPIWEGTTNVLCYDFARAVKYDEKRNTAFDTFGNFVRGALFNTIVTEGGFYDEKELKEAITLCVTGYNKVYADVLDMLESPKRFFELEDSLRNICYGVARIFVATLLLDVFVKKGLKQDKEIFLRWVHQGELYVKKTLNKALTKQLALDLDEKGMMRGVGNKDSNGIPRARF